MPHPRLLATSTSALAGTLALIAACTSVDTPSEPTASTAAPLTMTDWAITNLGAGDFATWAATPGVQVLTGKFLAPGTSAFDRARAVDAIALVGGSGWASIPVARVDGDHMTYTNEWVGSDFNARVREPGATVVTGDFNSDGRLDIAVLGSASSTSVHFAFSNGDGSWRVFDAGGSTMASAVAVAGVRPTVGDFDGDGYADIALPGRDGTSIPVYLSNGDGSFRAKSFATPLTAYLNAPGAKLFCADFNGDHKDDLVLAGGAGWSFVPVALSNGDGSFRVTTTPIDQFAGWATQLDAHGARVAIYTGDFNGDGRADLGLAGGNGWATLPLAFSNGDGSFTVRNGWVGDYDAWVNQTPIAPIVRDFDGDHRDDVALVGGGGWWGTIPIARSQGDGSFVVQNIGGRDVGPFDGWAINYGAKVVAGEFGRPGEVAIGLVGGAGWWTVPFATPRCDGATCPGVFTPAVATQHNDNARTGLNPNELALTPANVRKETFGQLFRWDVIGQVHAQPLYVPNAIEGRDMLYVATEANWIYAFDPQATSAIGPKRKIQLGSPVPGRLPLNTPWHNNNVWPLMGVTSTPVVDRRSNTLYVVSAEMALVSSGETGTLTARPVFRLHALDLDTLADRPNSPVTIAGHSSTSMPHDFLANPYVQRAGLLLSGDQIVVAFGSNTGDYTVPDPTKPFLNKACPVPGAEPVADACDCDPKYPVDTEHSPPHCPLDPKMNYVGWVMTYSKRTLAQSGTFVTAPYSLQGGVWQGGAGLVANERGDIYAQTGNGYDPVNDYGNSLVRLVRFPRSPGLLLASKLTVPTANDNDLGSAGPMLLPGTNHIIGGGKDGIVYVLDQNAVSPPLWQGMLGDAVHPGPHPIVGSPAYWNGNVYVWGAGDVLRALPVTPTGLLVGLSSDGKSSTLPAHRVGADVAPSPKGAFLSISSRGDDAGTAVVWANVPVGGEAATRLVAYDATDVRSPIWTSDLAMDAVPGAGRFAVPTVAGGRVFLGTYKPMASPADHVDGQIEGYVTVYGPVRRDVSDAGTIDGASACAPTGTDAIDTSWNTSSTSIYPTYFEGSTSAESLGHCAGCHLAGRYASGYWSIARDDADAFYDALALVTPSGMSAPMLIAPTAGDPRLSSIGDPARTPLAWYAPTSGLKPMPQGEATCDAHAARAITAWLAAGAPRR
jgi:hypothetical protein